MESRNVPDEKTMRVHQSMGRVPMVRNLGFWDRAIRLTLSLFLLSFYFMAPISDLWSVDQINVWTLLPLLGIYPGATAIIGSDPIYGWLGINTNPNSPKGQKAQLQTEMQKDENIHPRN